MILIPYSNIWSYPKVVSPHSGHGRLTNRRYPGVRCVHIDLFNLIRASNPTKVKTGSRPCAPHEVPLLTLTAPRVIEMDKPAATDSSGVPSTIERSPLDFAHEAGASDQGAAAPEMPSSEDVPATAAPGAGQAEETATMDPSAAPECRKRGRDETDVNAPKYEDERVERRCAELDARLDALSIDFDEELYPHMLTAIAGRRWVVGHGLRLAMMKCAESLEMRQAFADVVSARIAKGMSKGLKHGVEHGQAQLTVESIEAYDPEAEAKFVAALQSLKDLKYPLLDQLEGLKDLPMDVIMAALYLESDTEGDAPQYIRDLRPSSSQLTIPVYMEVRNPRNPWAYKEEIKLSDAIAANISRAEKKKKCRIVCRTHGVGSAHHARSDGVSVSVPTVVPQGFALLLVDTATQTDLEDA
nr:hypothetical protein [Tanacetum cinerariifolium]